MGRCCEFRLGFFCGVLGFAWGFGHLGSILFGVTMVPTIEKDYFLLLG